MHVGYTDAAEKTGSRNGLLLLRKVAETKNV